MKGKYLFIHLGLALLLLGSSACTRTQSTPEAATPAVEEEMTTDEGGAPAEEMGTEENGAGETGETGEN